MSTRREIDPASVESRRTRLSSDAEAGGYHLNPDAARTERIVKGLLTNEARYGYGSCPCRLAVGDRAKDVDIICPCYYRDADLVEWGACFCGLYVSGDVLRAERKLSPVPERRPPGGAVSGGAPPPGGPSGGKYPAWRCRVCGYLCAREGPPEVCPICKASRDRFERYL